MADDILVSSDTSLISADNERGTVGRQPDAPLRGTYTVEDLIVRALQRLGEIGDGQSAEPETAARVRRALPGILAELYADGIYTTPIDDEVPAAVMDLLSAVVASRLSDDFGLSQNEVVTLASRAQAAEQKLRRFEHMPYAGRRSNPCYF